MKKSILIIFLCVCTLMLLAGCTKSCEECEGAGEVTCGVCDGNGQVECPYCKGEKDQNEQCHKCEGSGVVTVELSTPKRCPECDGKGRTLTASGEAQWLRDILQGIDHGESYYMSTCDVCNGSGRITTEEKDCEECEGKGYFDRICSTCSGNGYIECETCSGSGKVTCPVCDGAGKVKRQ